MKNFIKMLIVLIFMTSLSSRVFSQGDQTELTSVEDWSNGGRALDLPEVGIKCKRFKTGAIKVTELNAKFGFIDIVYGWFSASETITRYEYSVVCDNGYENTFWM